MLGKSGTKRLQAGAPRARRNCTCPECDLTPDPQVQRKREKRDWQAEIDTPSVGHGDAL
jgi:hypothetical protein